MNKTTLELTLIIDYDNKYKEYYIKYSKLLAIIKIQKTIFISTKYNFIYNDNSFNLKSKYNICCIFYVNGNFRLTVSRLGEKEVTCGLEPKQEPNLPHNRH